MKYEKEDLIRELNVNQLPEIVCYACNISLRDVSFKQLLKPTAGVVRNAYGINCTHNMAYDFHAFGKRDSPLSKSTPVFNYTYGDLKVFSSMEECVEAFEIEKAKYIRHIELRILKQQSLIQKL